MSATTRRPAAIKAAGYATDPGYPQKLIGLIEKYGLTVYDGKAEQEDKASMNISITKKTSTHNTRRQQAVQSSTSLCITPPV